MKFKKRFSIENRQVGEGSPVFVIAEAGSNHDGSLTQAKRLINAAAEMGADAIKFQSYSGKGLVNPALQPDAYEIINRIATPMKWLPALAEHSRKRGLAFLSTPFDCEQLEALEAVGAPAYKIASGDVTNLPFIEAIARKRKPILLSVGCTEMSDIALAVETIRGAGNDRLVLLQCVVAYPTVWADANVAVVQTLHSAFGCPVGYSDHSSGDLVPIIAASHGACVIEKHFTFGRHLPGPDHPFAMEIPEFSEMVRKLRAVPGAVGSPVKKILACEKEETIMARRAIYAARDIAAGEKITRDMLLVVRPAQGLPPRELPRIVGHAAARNIKAFAAIKLEQLK